MRERWPSRLLFIYAAIGSAAGLGNLWRFPYLAGKYGGGAFLVPYLVMLFTLGIPLLIMELGLGQKMQQGAMNSFSKISRTFESIGFTAIYCAFIVTCYYAVIMAWCLLYTYHGISLGWGNDTKSFFFNEFLQLSSGPEEIGAFNPAIITALFLCWVAIYFSIFKGVKSVSAVVKVTLPLPIIIMLILLLRGLTLDNMESGLAYYLSPNLNALVDIQVWIAAISQIFFTLTLAFGVMIAYGSFQESTDDISQNAFIIALGNSLISIVAGFLVFSTLGYMAAESQVSVDSLAQSGPSLAFIVFPKVINLLPFASIFAILFFIMLLTLAIDSAFSLIEACVTSWFDKCPHYNRASVALVICVCGFLLGLVFCTQAGLYYLDITDHFITNYGLVWVGFCQVIVVGWVYGAEKMRNYINEVSNIRIGYWWTCLIKYFIPIVLFALLVLSLIKDINHPYENYADWALLTFGWLPLLLGIFISVYFALRKGV